MHPILLHLAPPALYLALWFVCWRTTGLHLQPRNRAASRALLGLALVGHALTLGDTLFGSDQFQFGLTAALSLTLWLAMLFYALESLLVPLEGLLVFVTPIAALAAALPAFVQGHPMVIPLGNPLFRLHIIVAMLAYSLFTLAAFHAVLMLAIEKSLHSAVLSPRLSKLPPLLWLERLLFRLIGAAFVLLTATVVSGAFFSEQIFGKPFEINHKSVFSLLAWVVFGALLTGRLIRGWRGRTALRWALAGMALMFFAYVGSRFVLEFLLGRSSFSI